MQTITLHSTLTCNKILSSPPPSLSQFSLYSLSLSLSLSLSETVVNYKQTVQSAFLEVQDILGDLGLGNNDDHHGNDESVQEVNVSYHGDGDLLESPPDSEESEKDPFEVLDSLLDFGLDDDLTISKGSGDKGGSGADLVKSTIEVQRALKVREKYLKVTIFCGLAQKCKILYLLTLTHMYMYIYMHYHGIEH